MLSTFPKTIISINSLPNRDAVALLQDDWGSKVVGSLTPTLCYLGSPVLPLQVPIILSTAYVLHGYSPSDPTVSL